jgi:hypothetical protein
VPSVCADGTAGQLGWEYLPEHRDQLQQLQVFNLKFKLRTTPDNIPTPERSGLQTNKPVGLRG